jgi:coatomer protein complex subunit epsilon
VSTARAHLPPLTPLPPLVTAVTLLAQYIASPSEATLDSLRDIVIELEEAESTPQTAIAKAAAATAFVRAGELEEAVDVLSSEDKSLEW